MTLALDDVTRLGLTLVLDDVMQFGPLPVTGVSVDDVTWRVVTAAGAAVSC